MSQLLAYKFLPTQCLATCRSFAAPAGRKHRPISCSVEKAKPEEVIPLNWNQHSQKNSYAHAGFPPGFLFGAASAAYQVEGATTEGGRGPCIWDTFCANFPEKIADGSNGEPGAGSYYYYKRDVQLLKELGVNVYRFSISWSRLLPTGRGEPNEEAIQYYKNLIQELKHNGIKPFVTIFHWDVPQTLDDEYGGFLSDKIVDDYKYFADVCFKNFGDEVKHWISLNEPLTFSNGGYSLGLFAPGRCTPGLIVGGQEYTCPTGDSLREPYIVSHNLLKAHAEVVKHYRENYKAKQCGKIGITLVSNWFVPYTDNPLSEEAQKRALEFNLGWFLDPLKFGDYPFSMKSLVRDRLPQFSKEESEKLKNSYDFIGLNYYTSLYAKNKGFQLDYQPKVYSDDMRVDTPDNKNGVPIGYVENQSWVYVYPRGLKDLLLYMKERYNNPEVYITENGVMQVRKNDSMLNKQDEELRDTYREQYQSIHLHELVEAIRQGVRLKGYFVWSLQDSFEWNTGYTSKFGLTYVNNGPNVPYKDLVKLPKHSFQWYKWFISIAKAPYFGGDGIPTPLVLGEEEEETLDNEEYKSTDEEVNVETPLTPTRVSAVY